MSKKLNPSVLSGTSLKEDSLQSNCSPSFFRDAKEDFGLEGVCLQSSLMLASLRESSLSLAVFSIAVLDCFRRGLLPGFQINDGDQPSACGLNSQSLPSVSSKTEA